MPVYLIRAGLLGDVKIGVAKDPVARLRQLQTSLPIKLHLIRVLDGERALEKALHERFAPLRKAGEWFSFSAEMRGDLGAPDLPLPRSKRASGLDLSTPYGRWNALVKELFVSAGGEEALAKAMGVMPWVVNAWNIHPWHLSALVVLARQGGLDVTLKDVVDAKAELDRDSQASAAKQEAERSLQLRIDREKAWVKKHGAAKAWWPLLAESAAQATSNDHAAVPTNEGAA